MRAGALKVSLRRHEGVLFLGARFFEKSETVWARVSRLESLIEKQQGRLTFRGETGQLKRGAVCGKFPHPIHPKRGLLKQGTKKQNKAG